MESHVTKKGLLVLLTGSMLLSTASAHAFDLKTKHLALAGIIGVIGRLEWKANPREGRLKLQDIPEKLSTQLEKPSPAEIGQLLWNILDDIIIGYKGKISGFKVFGSKLVFDTNNSELVVTRRLNDNERLEFYKYPHQAPYGLCGTLWAYVKTVIPGLKTLNETYQLIYPKDSVFVDILGIKQTP